LTGRRACIKISSNSEKQNGNRPETAPAVYTIPFGLRQHREIGDQISLPTEASTRGGCALPLLPAEVSLLLVLPLRVQNLPGLHAGKPLGHVLQRHHLELPGLRRPKRLR
jgi:hypothetical protein